MTQANPLQSCRGYDSAWFRAALRAKGITPCIPPRKNRKIQTAYDKTLYKQRHKIKKMFDRLKHWRRVAMGYNCCAHTFFFAICIANTSSSFSINES
jgi:transposase